MPGYGLNEATADFVLVIVVGVNCWLGWRYGLVRRAIAFAAVYGATLSAYYVGNPLASTVTTGGLVANAWAFVAVFGVAVLMIEVLAALYSDTIQKAVVIVFDRAAGLAAGLLVGALELGVLLLVAQAVANAPPSTSTASTVDRTTVVVAADNGVLTQVIVRLEPGMQTLLGPALPGNVQDRLDGNATT
ncbi:MAG: CvpA family protein [Candidatus Dormibacteria bacterium]